MGAVETECPGLNFRQAGPATYTSILLGKNQLLPVFYGGLDYAVPFPQRGLDRLGHPAYLGVLSDDKPVHNDLDVMPLLPVQIQVVQFIQHVDGTIDPYPHEAGLSGGFEHVFVLPFFASYLGRQQQDAAALRQRQNGVGDLLHRLLFHGPPALGAVGRSQPGEQQPQVIVNFRDGAHGGAGVVGHALLVDGYSRR